MYLEYMHVGAYRYTLYYSLLLSTLYNSSIRVPTSSGYRRMGVQFTYASVYTCVLHRIVQWHVHQFVAAPLLGDCHASRVRKREDVQSNFCASRQAHGMIHIYHAMRRVITIMNFIMKVHVHEQKPSAASSACDSCAG